MPKLPVLKSKELLKYLLAYGCELIRVNGSHHRLRNKKNGRFGTLPVHNKDQKQGTFAGVLRELDINADNFIAFIKERGRTT